MAAVGEAFIEIKADTKNLLRSLQSDLNKIDASVDVGVKVSSAALRDVSRQISAIDGEVIDVGTDIDSADLDELVTQLSALDGEVIDSVVNVDDAEVDDLTTEISFLQGLIIDSVVNVDDADLDSLQTEIAAVDGAVVDLAVAISSGDLGALESAVSALDGRIIDLKVAVDGGDLDSVGDDLTQAAESGDAAAAAVGGIAASGGFSKAQAGAAGLAAGLGAVLLKTGEVDAGLREVASLQIEGFGLDEANDVLDEVIAKTGAASDDVIPALYNSLSAGVPPDNVLDFLVSANDLAVAGVADLEDSVGLLTGAANAYGDALGDPTAATNALFATVQSGVTTLPELGASLGQITPLAAELGVSWEELNAAVATSTQVTQNTSQSVTGLRTLFAELGTSTSKAGQAFEEISGTSFKEFTESGGDLEQALGLLVEQAENSGVGLNELFGSVDAGTVALQLAREDGEAFADTLNNVQEIAEAGVAVEAAVEINEEGFLFQLEQIKNRAINIFTNFGQEVAPFLSDGLSVINDLFADIDGAAIQSAFSDLFADADLDGLFSSIRTFGSGVAAVFNSLANALSGIDFSFIAEIFSSITSILSGLFTFIGDFLSENADTFEAVFEAIGSVFESLGNILADLFGLIEDNQDTIFSVLGFLGDIFVVIAEVAAFLIPIIADLVEIWVEFIVFGLNPIIDVIGFVVSAFQSLFDILGTVLEFLGEIITGIVDFVSEAIAAAVSFGQGIFDAIVGVLSSIGSTVGGFIGDAVAAVTGAVTSAFNAAKDFGSNIFNGIRDTVSGIAQEVKGAVTDAIDAITGLASDAYNAALDWAKQIFEGVKDGLAGVGNFIKDQLTFDFPDIPRPGVPFFADGGIVDSTTFGIIGEAGAEAVIPLTRPNRALELLRESGLDRLLLNNLAGGTTQGSVTTAAAVDSSTTNTNVQINVATQDGQDAGLIAEGLFNELSSSGSRGLAGI